MAATVSAWNKPGAWALDSEENEAELLQQHERDSFNGIHLSNGAPNNNSAPTADFPSLATAAASKPKKKKAQTLSLQEFATFGTTTKPSTSQASTKLTHEELLALPKAPRQRSAEELDRTKLGGGFRSYGNNYDRSGRDEQPRRQRDSSRDSTPSRADEIDDWVSEKKSTPGNGGNGFERRERGGFFTDSQSRADEVDNWVSNKAFVPSEGRRNDRRVGFESNNGGGADSENWVKRKEEEGRKFGGAFDSLRDRRSGVIDSANGGGGWPDSDTWGRKREEVNTTTTNVGGRPRLNLQPRTLPVVREQQHESVVVKPFESVVVKPKGSSPFGDARPREEVLKEKGQDWKQIDEKLESAKIKEVVEEKQPAFGKRGFGCGNWRGNLPLQEDKIERTWRKPELQPDDARPLSSSAEKTEDIPFEEAQDKGSDI